MRTVTTTKYIALDDTEFDNEVMCAEYETSYKLEEVITREFGTDANVQQISDFVQDNWSELCVIIMGITE